MMTAAYVTPVVATAQGFEPAGRALARTCPGWTRSAAQVDQRRGLALFYVWADSLAALDADARLTPLGRGASFAGLTQSVTAVAPAAVTAFNTRYGLGLAGTDRQGATVLRLARLLDPAAHSLMYDSPTPQKSQTITDAFTRADAGTLGVNWTNLEHGWKIVSNKARQVTNYALNSAYYVGTFPNDQYAQADGVFALIGGDSRSFSTPMVRAQAGPTYYFLQLDAANAISLYKKVAGSASFLTDCTVTLAAETVYTFKLDATGTTVTVYFSGSSVGSVTDSAIASGSPGIFGAISGTAQADVDNFQCTDVVASALFPQRASARHAVTRASFY
jgi:hypothetical protein